MKKFLFLLSVLFLVSETSFGQTVSLEAIRNAESLGATAGPALACNAGKKLEKFELIASYLIGGQASNPKERKELFEFYAAEKLRTYNLQKKSPPSSCSEVLNSFSSLPIFKATVYKDGKVKMPDGKIITPKPLSSDKPRTNMVIKNSSVRKGR